MKAIEVKELSKHFNRFTAVDNITFAVDQGEIFGFLGPNGAGKTTTIRMLCGILKPTSGSGHVAGMDIVRENEKIKAHIGYMTQKFSLYQDLTVEENIAFFASIYHIDPEKIDTAKKRALETAGLINMKKHLTRDLPGGFKQRLSLACALMHSPSIVFLDEPTAGVDPLARRCFWDIIYRLKNEEHTTVFVTTHYLDEAEHCERIALIRQGRIAALGSPADLKSRVRDRVMVVQGNPFASMKHFFEKEPGITQVIPYGLSLHVFTRDDKDPDDLKAGLHRSGVTVSRLEDISPSLEDVFISLSSE
ncbi:MAG TPA: ABC transporter ATP-binding protein [bacterium]